MSTVGCDHEKTKKETHERVVAIWAKKAKCPLGRKCEDDSDNLKKLGNFVPCQKDA